MMKQQALLIEVKKQHPQKSKSLVELSDYMLWVSIVLFPSLSNKDASTHPLNTGYNSEKL